MEDIYVTDPIPETEEDLKRIASGDPTPQVGDAITGAGDGQHILHYRDSSWLITVVNERITEKVSRG